MPHSSLGDNRSQSLAMNSISFREGLNCSKILIAALLVPAPHGHAPAPICTTSESQSSWEASGETFVSACGQEVGQPEQQEKAGERPWPRAPLEQISHFPRVSLCVESWDSALLEGKAPTTAVFVCLGAMVMITHCVLVEETEDQEQGNSHTP